MGPPKEPKSKKSKELKTNQLQKMADGHRTRIYVSSGDENSSPHDWVASAVTYWTRSPAPFKKKKKEDRKGKKICGKIWISFLSLSSDLWCHKVFLSWIKDILYFLLMDVPLVSSAWLLWKKTLFLWWMRTLGFTSQARDMGIFPFSG